MQIGSLTFAPPVITLAPLAGYGDVAFRLLCRDYGASLTVTEMVSAKGLVYGNEKTETLLRTAPGESPACVQLFGSDPDCFYRAIRLPALNKFDMIDVNMGCPVPKITKCGEGGALMRTPDLAAEIVRACVAAANGRPVTVKHRLGYGQDEFTAPDFAAKMQAAGATAITVHGRTVAQGYAGTADWQKIAQTVRAVSVPVLGNGDIRSRNEAIRACETYGCAGVAVGRGALGHPDLFAAHPADPVGRIVVRHIRAALAYFPEAVAVRTLRKHLCRYLAGVPGTKALKLYVNTVTSATELLRAVTEALPC